jgi:predicted enzyme related to lactoylglutathione lyase
MMPKVVHFEINVDTTEKAAEFYKNVFGWKFDRWEGNPDYWMVSAGEEGEPGIDGAIQKRDEPGATAYIIIGVSSIDEYMKKVEENGGKIVAPKMPIPGIGYAAYFTDLDGNKIGLFQSDKEAK